MNCGINGTILSTELDRLRAAIPVLIKGAPQYTTEFNKNVNIGGNKILKISFFSFLQIKLWHRRVSQTLTVIY